MPARERPQFNRREFLQSAAVTGAGLMVTLPTWAQDAAPPAPGAPQAAPEPGATTTSAREVKVAVIGAGGWSNSQGLNLVKHCLKIPGIRFAAVCDIWPYAQRYTTNVLKKFEHTPNVYADYREMLEKEKDLEAVIVATPDWMHAEHSIACLEAGKHVYCEKEMSNTIEGARQMVEAARRTKKLLQIGHQRRSNPRYWHALKMIEKDNILGRITHCFGQWNRPRLVEIEWVPGEELDDATLEKYGYDSMDAFRNWRWYRKYSGGPMADLGSHQVDVFNWFLKTPPKAVMATGGLDFYTEQKGRDWYDNVLALYEYQTPAGPVRAFYQVLNTTSYGGFFETLMGHEGSLVISEDPRRGQIFREQAAPKREWENEADKIETMDREAINLALGKTLRSDGTPDPEGERLAAEAQKPPHQLHLENFFSAVRDGTPLSCPAEVAFEVCVTVLKANEAVAKGTRIELKPEDFKA
ncbi:MAG: Gfo/Idh/MocA family oxidoreductase [Planctomycetota bacterium]